MDLPSATTLTSATWNYGGGRTITIEFEDVVMGGFQRPTRVRGGMAVIKPAPSRDSTLLPLAVQDDEMWTGYKESSFEGGHIIGLALGGPDHPANIAPMTKGSNCGSGTWGNLEREIKTMIRLGGAVTVDLTLSYNDAVDPRVPARVAGSINGGGLVTMVNHAIAAPHDLTNILTPKLKSIFSDIRQLSSDIGIDDSNPHARLDVIDRTRNLDQDTLNRVRDVRARIRTIPILATYPSTGIGPKLKKGRVLPVQRVLLLLHNRYLNDGLLMAEDIHNLGLMMREWQAQVDHIRPYARSKDSSYKNLRLLHHRTNNKRGMKGINAGGRQKRVRKAPNRYSPQW